MKRMLILKLVLFFCVHYIQCMCAYTVMAKALITKLNICLNSYLQLLFLDLGALFFIDLLHAEYKIKHSASKVRTFKDNTFVFAPIFRELNSDIHDCPPSALLVDNQDSSMRRPPLQNETHHRMWAFAQVGYDERRIAVRSRPEEDDKHADKLPGDPFWQFVQTHFFSSCPWSMVWRLEAGWMYCQTVGIGHHHSFKKICKQYLREISLLCALKKIPPCIYISVVCKSRNMAQSVWSVFSNIHSGLLGCNYTCEVSPIKLTKYRKLQYSLQGSYYVAITQGCWRGYSDLPLTAAVIVFTCALTLPIITSLGAESQVFNPGAVGRCWITDS